MSTEPAPHPTTPEPPVGRSPEDAPVAVPAPASPRSKPEGLVRPGPSRLGFWDETGR